jgi:hypothetical protein
MHHGPNRFPTLVAGDAAPAAGARSIIGIGEQVRAAAALGALLLLVACSDHKSAAKSSAPPPATGTPAAAVAVKPTALEAQLKQENARLLAEVQALKEQVKDLAQTPQVLFDRVQSAVKNEKLSDAHALANKLEQRYGTSAQSKVARANIAQLQAKLKAKEEQAQRLEAMGFYALKPTSAAKIGDFIVKVDSISLGKRWLFDSHGDSYMYRDSRLGQKFVLLKTTLQTTDKNPDPYLPDIAVYRIKGKTMSRLEPMNYEFRKWQSYGTFIGLYHDFKNDFAHSASVAFNAGAGIDEDIAKTPFAVVVTAGLCHERKTRIGQPEIEYRYRYQCDAKKTLTADDFKSTDYQVLSFFNKPKGL